MATRFKGLNSFSKNEWWVEENDSDGTTEAQSYARDFSIIDGHWKVLVVDGSKYNALV